MSPANTTVVVPAGGPQGPPGVVQVFPNVADEVAMLGLSAKRGAVAVRTDTKQTFVLNGDNAAVLSQWVPLLNAVVSVNGETGVVTGLALQSDLLAEQTNRAAGDATTLAAAETYANNALASALAGISPAEFAADAQGSGLTHSGVGQVVGGVTITAGMRVLDTAPGVSSGLWVAAAGAWTRPVDFATGSNAQGKLVEVTGGGVWLCIASSLVTVDTTPQVWAEIDASVVQAGTGLSKTGNVISLALTKALVLATELGYSDVGADAAGAAAAETTRAAAAEALLAPLASPTFTGHVTVPTPTNSTDAATKAYTDSAITSEASARSSADATTLASAHTYTDGAVATEASRAEGIEATNAAAITAEAATARAAETAAKGLAVAMAIVFGG